MLDTSAVIGWVERQAESIITYLDEHVEDDEIPCLHVVTLGELEQGIAMAADDAARDKREATKTFAEAEIDCIPLDMGHGASDHIVMFGMISSVVNRGVSQNDRWVAAAAILEGHTLLTQDKTLAASLERAADDERFKDWLHDNGLSVMVEHCA